MEEEDSAAILFQQAFRELLQERKDFSKRIEGELCSLVDECNNKVSADRMDCYLRCKYPATNMVLQGRADFKAFTGTLRHFIGQYINAWSVCIASSARGDRRVGPLKSPDGRLVFACDALRYVLRVANLYPASSRSWELVSQVISFHPGSAWMHSEAAAVRYMRATFHEAFSLSRELHCDTYLEFARELSDVWCHQPHPWAPEETKSSGK